MVILSENDYLDVKLKSLIADYDTETLSNLYQPIIGYSALAVYFTLVAEAKNQEITSVISHNQLLNRLQMSPGDFIEARQRLEAVGLLRTYVEGSGKAKAYYYRLYAPKTPYDFFADVLLYGMLIKAIGEVDAKRFKTVYQRKTESAGEEITSSFNDVFKPNFNDSSFSKALQGIDGSGRRTGKIKSEFNYDLFFEQLYTNNRILKDAFTKQDMKEIERLATLNGVTEEDTAYVVGQIYEPLNPKGKHVNYEVLAKMLQENPSAYYSHITAFKRRAKKKTGGDDLAAKIKFMEQLAPKDYLKLLQGGSEVALSDLRLIDEISKKYGLKNGVINALIDYVLTTNEKVLSRYLCDKLASSLAAEKIDTVYDAMQYLAAMRRKRIAWENKARLSTDETMTNSEKKSQLKDILKGIVSLQNDDEGDDENGEN